MFLGAVSGGLVALGLIATAAGVGYASRIARLRGYYFRHAPDLVDYLMSVRPEQRLNLQGIGGGRWQRFFTAAAMVGLVTAVLAGSAIGLLTAVVWDHVLAAALTVGGVVAIAVFAALIRFGGNLAAGGGPTALTTRAPNGAAAQIPLA